MVHPVHGKDPDKQEHRTYKTLTPAGEIAVVQRPEGVLKLVVYTGSGENRRSIPRSSWTATTPLSSPWKSCSTPTVWARGLIDEQSESAGCRGQGSELP